MEKSELVSFKGMVDGVRINLDGDTGIFDLLQVLEAKICENKGFFGTGDCRISFGGRRFSASEKQRLEELAKRLLPLCRVDFESEKPKTLPQTDWISAYKEKGEPKKSEDEKESSEQSEDDDDFVSVFRSNRARLYEGIVKDGMTLHSDGHLVLFGTAKKGASLIATGNIIVIGGLYGTAHAGCNGHNGSYIMAMDMRPEGLAIANTAQEYVYTEEEQIHEVDIAKKGIFDKFKKKSEHEEIAEKDTETELNAVALLKNNKIEVNKFSIQDFTNHENMV